MTRPELCSEGTHYTLIGESIARETFVNTEIKKISRDELSQKYNFFVLLIYIKK